MIRMPSVGDQFGRYVLLRPLGQGGMGLVYAARDTSLDREVALKIIAPHLAGDVDYRARFTREATVLSQMSSPHVVAVHDYGERDGCLFLVTQLVPGGDLATQLGQGPVAPVEALGLVSQILEGLADAHDVGVVHRDVKPSNVLLRRRGGRWEALLCDFGIATSDGGEAFTRTGSLVGSTPYMAPERHQGDDSGVPGDVYAVGCLLWRVLTGVTPYAGSEVEVAVAHLQAPVPQLPGDDVFAQSVNTLLQRAMAKAPGDRYASARAMAADCLAAAAVAPSVATLPERTQVRQRIPLGGVTPPPTPPPTDHPTPPPTARPTPPPPVLPVPGPGSTRLRPARSTGPRKTPAAAPVPTPARRWRRPALATLTVLALVGGGFAAAQAVRDDTAPAAGPSAASDPSPDASETATVLPGTELAQETQPRRRAAAAEVRLPDTGDFLSGAGEADGATTGALPDMLAPLQPAGPRPGRSGRPGRDQGGTGRRGGAASTPTPQPAPEPEPEPTYRCWNGAETMGPDDCTLPTGTAGLAWVYPGLRGCREEGSLSGRVTTVVCAYDTADGPGELRLIEWSSSSAANQSYREKYGKTARPWRSSWGYTWVARTQRTNLYGDGPFSATAKGGNKRVKNRMLDRLDYRRPRDLRGQPIG